MRKTYKPQGRGPLFESRVVDAIRSLEQIGFARGIRTQETVVDRDGHPRKLDVSFVLCTYAIELLVSIECKSRKRPLTLDDINQIKTFKHELPERNIFWLVVEGSAGENVIAALRSAGISYYEIEDLEARIGRIVDSYRNSGLPELRHQKDMFSISRVWFAPGDELLTSAIHFLESALLLYFPDVHSKMSASNGKWQPRISR